MMFLLLHLQQRLLQKLYYIFSYLYFTVAAAMVVFLTHLRNRYSVIHAHNPPDTLFILGLLGKIFSIKFVFDHHDLSPELYLTRFSGKRDLFYRALLLCEKISCRVANVVISTNHSYKKIVEERHKINPDKIFIVRNDPVIPEQLAEIQPRGNHENGRRILYLGSINPQDGVDLLLKAIHHLVYCLDEKDFICDIVGDGDALEDMKLLAKRHNIDDHVHFTGYVYDQEEVWGYLRGADVCVESAPANELNVHSTFIKIMEYMAAGKPLVAYDLKETRYSTNGSAILIPSGDIEQFSHAIKRLLEDPQLREELGKSGSERIKQELNWERASLNLIKTYESIPYS
jgi:glycosyltransferase involved in cell wall biosynthesis